MPIPEKALIPVDAILSVRPHLEPRRAETLEGAGRVVTDPKTAAIVGSALVNVGTGSIEHFVAGVTGTDRTRAILTVANVLTFAALRLGFVKTS